MLISINIVMFTHIKTVSLTSLLHVNFLWAVNLFLKKSSANLNTPYLTSIKKYLKNLNSNKSMEKLPCV